MQKRESEKSLTKLLNFGMFFTTVFIISGSVTDPVNVPKLLVLGIFGSSAFALLMFTDLKNRLRTQIPLVATSILFIIAMFSAVIFSKSPISQNVYGSFGRNNGLLCYLFLNFLLLAYASTRSSKGFQNLIKALIVAGGVNLAYCAWVIAFGDFVGWFNPYRGILGTFGNPNFIGAYLGIFFGVCIAIASSPGASTKFRISMILVLPLTFFEILKSHAVQGRVVAALGLGIVGFFLVRAHANRYWLIAYSFLSISIGSLALTGALQHGPLVKYIYKTSVSLRGQYWLAAWNTGSSNPFTGVGMDSFGDWYRRSRDIRAITLPGVNTTVNTAHNVWMDMFAFGGWPLLFSYLLIIALTTISIIKVLKRSKKYDSIFVALTTSWVGYQVQSLISINQIGLAIWGWALSGALIAFEISSREVVGELNPIQNSKGRPSAAVRGSQQTVGVLAATGGAMIGLLIVLPPFTGDTKLRSAQLSNTLPALEKTMEISYFNPATTNKYLNNIQALEVNNLFDLSHKYAKSAIEWNPESFELWKAFYSVRNSTPQEKATALRNMKRLDPLNPDVTSTK